MSTIAYNDNVFINCPFDDEYKSLFNAMVFAIHDCSFVARSAQEAEDGSQVRIDKIYEIIDECRHGIHDLSRTELDRETCLPRFNMPLELGVFLGAKRYGEKEQQRKSCLILDKERYRYQKFISDISGQDVKSHENNPKEIIHLVRDWLSHASNYFKEVTVMPRERTIKGPAKRGTITKRQARAAAREVLEERYGKAKSYETAGKAAKKSARSGKQQTASTSNKRGNRT